MPDARLSAEASAHYSLIFPFGLTSVLGTNRTNRAGLKMSANRVPEVSGAPSKRRS